MAKKKQKQESAPLTADELEIMQNYNRTSFWSLIGDTQSFIKDFDAAKK